MNERDYYFSIYEDEKNIFQSTYKQASTSLGYINEVSIQFGNKYHDLYQKVTQYAQDLQILNCTYPHLKMNENNFNCAKITDKTISACTEEKQSGNEDKQNNNCERNTSIKNKISDKNVSKQKETRTTDKASAEDDTYLNNPPLF